MTSNLHHEIYKIITLVSGERVHNYQLTPLCSMWGFLISNQHGPMILRFSTRSSNAEVLAPNILEKFGLDTSLGIWGSDNRFREEYVDKLKRAYR